MAKKPSTLSAQSKKPTAKAQLARLKSPPKSPVDFNQGLKALKKHYPDAHCALNFSNPFELLIATILSAQCTDVMVNKVTPELFKQFPNANALSQAPIGAIEALIHSAGFYKNKAKNIKACCQQLVEKHGAQVPQTIEALYELAGVGRKTANVVLGNAYNIASGVVVDTHVTRLSNRLGWVKEADAVKIENKLNALCPQDDWVMLSHYLISHGRAICTARSPQCASCFLLEACPRRGI